MVVFIMAGGDHPGQDCGRIGHCATIHPTVQVAVGAGHFHFNVAESTNAGIYRWRIHADHGRIADQHHICFQ